MSGDQGYPPPGRPDPSHAWSPAPGPFTGAPEASGQPVAPPPWSPAPGMLGAAHKPGAVPLRPLTIGDMYDAAFRIIRFNPKATVGSAVLVASVAMALPILVTGVMSWTVGVTLDQTGGTASTAELVGLVSSFGALGVGSVLQGIGLILVTGMIAHVTAAAALGRRLSLGEAWRATHGKRWKLIGLAALLAACMIAIIGVYALAWLVVFQIGEVVTLVIFGLITGPLFLGFLCWFWVRVYYLPVPALMLEPIGVFEAVGRGFRLTRRQFWRTFGIALLTVIIAQVAGSILSMPITLVSQLFLVGGGGAGMAVFALVVANALASVIAAAFVAPFTTAVASLQYLDQRMRKEAYDVELMTRAGLTPP